MLKRASVCAMVLKRCTGKVTYFQRPTTYSSDAPTSSIGPIYISLVRELYRDSVIVNCQADFYTIVHFSPVCGGKELIDHPQGKKGGNCNFVTQSQHDDGSFSGIHHCTGQFQFSISARPHSSSHCNHLRPKLVA